MFLQEGWTALAFAASNGDAVMVQTLVDSGADVNLPDKVASYSSLLKRCYMSSDIWLL